MSEEQRITKVEKEKDPRRVESGKRLGAISRTAKKNKAYERQRMERIDEESDEGTRDGGYSTITVLTGIGILSGLVCLYFTYKQDKRAQATIISRTNTQPTNPEPPNNPPQSRLLTLDE